MDHDEGMEAMKGVRYAMNQLFKEMLSDGIEIPALLGGTSMALIMLAHKLGFDKESLKHRVCGDIDIIYYEEDGHRKEHLQ